MKNNRSLDAFFKPRGIAIVGASQHPSKLGYGLARNLVQSDYRGSIHFVNPKGGELLDREIYPDIATIQDPVDLAVLLIPAPAVPRAVRQCGERGIPAVIIASGGFRETGSEGEALEKECLRIAKEYEMRLVGPNCIGILDTHLPMDTTFLPPPGPPAGDVAFISHSGAICAAVIDWARGQGFGLSRLVSLGNQVDVNETDMLAPVVDDRYTRVVTLYLEGVADGRRFVDEAAKATRKKPVIALKVGRFESGQRAVASHTGALAGQESAFNAAFRRAGVIRAETSEEIFDWARALAWCPPPEGRGVAVLTNSGGPGVTAADALEALGMQLAELGDSTVSQLRQLLHPAASLHNPIDMLAAASPEQYTASLQILLDDPAVHSVMVILPPPPMYTAAGVVNAIIPIIQQAIKPVVLALMGERLIHEAVERARAARVPEYRFPERAASALAVLAKRAEYLARTEDQIVTCQDVDPQEVAAVLESLKVEPGDFLPNGAASQVLAAYGIPTQNMHLAADTKQAVGLASQVGFPVVLKVASPDIPHKSDVDGVMLNLLDAQAVERGFDLVVQNAHAARPEAEIQGVFVQRMVPEGQEVIVGAVHDAQFGPLVMFGSGGTEVEGLKDVAFALAPLTLEEPSFMLENTWAGQKLKGFRNLPPADHQAVQDVLIRVAQLAADFPQIGEVEINPLRVMPQGKGACALDVRIRLV